MQPSVTLNRRRDRWWGFTGLVLGVGVVVPVVATLSTVFMLGWKLQPIETGSMAPRYPAGSLAVVSPIDGSEVKPGMVVVFEDPRGPGSMIAHRVVAPSPGDRLMWTTRGDANPSDDPFPITPAAVSGRVRWGIPFVGTVVSALSGSATPYYLIGIPLALLVGNELIELRNRRRPKNAG
jgi:signal peptidase